MVGFNVAKIWCAELGSKKLKRTVALICVGNTLCWKHLGSFSAWLVGDSPMTGKHFRYIALKYSI